MLFFSFLATSNGTVTATVVTFAHFTTISEAFSFLTSKVKSQLKVADIYDIKRACIEQKNNPDAVQLPPDLVAKVKSSESIDDLFNVLAESPYWSWIDIRLLKVMAAASGLLECIQLLSSYKSSVFTRKLIEVIPNAPNKKVREKYYSKIVAKIDKDANEITVADLLDFQGDFEKVILDINKGVCILKHVKVGSIEVHWYIPKNCVDSAYQSATTRAYMFSEVHLLWVQISHYPVIYDPFTQSATQKISTPLASAGKWYLTIITCNSFELLYSNSEGLHCPLP